MFKIARIEKLLNEFSPVILTLQRRGYSKDAALLFCMFLRLEDTIDILSDSLLAEEDTQQEDRSDDAQGDTRA
jgi:hypothetical protein